MRGSVDEKLSKYLNIACAAFLHTFVRLQTPHGHVSNVPHWQTYKHRTEACRTFWQYSVCTQQVTRVKRRHLITTVFFEFYGQTSQCDQLTMQHWHSVHFRDLLDSKNCHSVHDYDSFNSKLPVIPSLQLDTSHFHQNSVFFYHQDYTSVPS